MIFPDTGFTTDTMACQIRAGTVKDRLLPIVYGVGYYGDGPHVARVNGKDTLKYKCWNRMMERCYSEKSQIKNHTYRGCTVCHEWHNYQVFAEWHEKNYPKDGEKYELDKDIKLPGNKVYSPQTCSFVTKKENSTECNKRTKSKLHKMISPSGERVDIVNMSEFSSINGLNRSHMIQVSIGNRMSHKGWTKG